MGQPNSLSRSDLSVLLRIVGSRNGANLDDILAFESSHHRQHPTAEQVSESLNRLLDAALIMRQVDHYVGTPQVQAAFLEACRNCCDTIEEFDVLNKIVAQFGVVNSEKTTPSEPPRSRWRGSA